MQSSWELTGWELIGMKGCTVCIHGCKSFLMLNLYYFWSEFGFTLFLVIPHALVVVNIVIGVFLMLIYTTFGLNLVLR